MLHRIRLPNACLSESAWLCCCVYPGSASEAIDDVVASFFDLPSTPMAPSAWFEEQFNAENQTRMLDAIIRSLHGSPMRDVSSQAESSSTSLPREYHRRVRGIKLGKLS
jgi:hypothetical protein